MQSNPKSTILEYEFIQNLITFQTEILPPKSLRFLKFNTPAEFKLLGLQLRYLQCFQVFLVRRSLNSPPEFKLLGLRLSFVYLFFVASFLKFNPPEFKLLGLR